MEITNLVREIVRVTKKIKQPDLVSFVDQVQKAQKVYVTGEGRSGLVAKSFAVRLARLGKMVYVVGETVTPPIAPNDLFIAVSGSGETKTVVETVKICRVMRGNVISLTATEKSSITRISHFSVVIQAHLPKRLGHIYHLRELIGVPERPPVASIFELASLIFLEAAAFKLEAIWQRNNRDKRLLPS